MLVTTIFDLRLQHSQQGVRLRKLLELIGLVSAETDDVTQSLRSVGLPLSRKSTHKKLSHGKCLLEALRVPLAARIRVFHQKEEVEMTFYLFIPLRVNELYESLCKLLLVQPL